RGSGDLGGELGSQVAPHPVVEPGADVVGAVAVHVAGADRHVVVRVGEAVVVGQDPGLVPLAEAVAGRRVTDPTDGGAGADVASAVAVEIGEPKGGVVPERVPAAVIRVGGAVDCGAEGLVRAEPAADPGVRADACVGAAVAGDGAHAARRGGARTGPGPAGGGAPRARRR